jgi:hypothetical protein
MTKCVDVEAFCYFKIAIFDLLHHVFLVKSLLFRNF